MNDLIFHPKSEMSVPHTFLHFKNSFSTHSRKSFFHKMIWNILLWEGTLLAYWRYFKTRLFFCNHKSKLNHPGRQLVTGKLITLWRLAPSWMALDKSHNCSKPLFTHLWNCHWYLLLHRIMGGLKWGNKVQYII